MPKSKAGANWLHWVKNQETRRRVWNEETRELYRRAERWLDEGETFDEVLIRIRQYREAMAGGEL